MGKCWHCNKRIYFNNRKHGLKGAWHIDHYPVVYRDIENQCCIGITDPLLVSNLYLLVLNVILVISMKEVIKFVVEDHSVYVRKIYFNSSFFIFINILFFILGILFSKKYL